MESSTPWWRVNRRPRFTALTFGSYMALDDGPRETLRRDMKYERVSRTLRNQEVQKAISRYLISPTRDMRILADCRAWLEEEIEASRSHQRAENLKHQLRSLDDFERSLNVLGLGGVSAWSPGHVFKPMRIEGVTVSVQPTAMLSVARQRGADLVGAILVDVSKGPSCKTEAAKAKAEGAMLHSAVLLHNLVYATSDPEKAKPSTEHCMVLHAHRGDLVIAPSGYKRLTRNMEAVCRDLVRAWPHIDAPPGFDERYATYRG